MTAVVIELIGNRFKLASINTALPEKVGVARPSQGRVEVMIASF